MSEHCLRKSCIRMQVWCGCMPAADVNRGQQPLPEPCEQAAVGLYAAESLHTAC